MKTNDNKQEPCPKCKSDDTTFHGNWTEDGVLPIPLTTGLDALSPYILSITADNGSIEKTNEFDHTWYDFSIDYNYQLNMLSPSS
ncbi:hypothetical protein [Nitrosopumilus sp.]|uniref:hypothetical protein n=1 Tax=Nitrosopumilus sp. TaxID=2024843 RepID=UPI002930F804|nr:hypothetical protein [Nitrosopumilus sp.]